MNCEAGEGITVGLHVQCSLHYVYIYDHEVVYPNLFYNPAKRTMIINNAMNNTRYAFDSITFDAPDAVVSAGLEPAEVLEEVVCGVVLAELDPPPNVIVSPGLSVWPLMTKEPSTVE